MKPLLRFTLLFIFLSFNKSYGQYEFNLGYMAPSGDISYLLKPAPSFEFVFHTGDVDSHYHFGFSLGYCSLSTTQDTFRTYAVGGPTGGVLPGYEVIHKYEVVPIGMRNEFILFPEKKLSPVLALDLVFNIISIDEDDYAETFIQSSETGDTYWSLAILPRFGAQYKLNDNIVFTAGFGRSMSFTGTVENDAYWKTYIGIKYYID